MNSINDCTILNNGVKMPWLGFGVWKIPNGEQTQNAVKTALEIGYRSIDTAAIYGNEEGVGSALKESEIPRDQIFVTTKLWNSDQGYDTALKAFETSRRKLGLDYIDLYLIHWPVEGKYKESWKALVKLQKDGLVRAIGVSNFHKRHIEDVVEYTGVVPAVDQLEFHPLLSQVEMRQYLEEMNIQMEGYSPLMQGNLNHKILNDVGQKYGKSAAQVVLRWALQNKVVVIPKSTNRNRIEENSKIFDFELSDEDMKAINSMNQNRRFGSDPDNFDF